MNTQYSAMTMSLDLERKSQTSTDIVRKLIEEYEIIKYVNDLRCYECEQQSKKQVV